MADANALSSHRSPEGNVLIIYNAALDLSKDWRVAEAFKRVATLFYGGKASRSEEYTGFLEAAKYYGFDYKQGARTSEGGISVFGSLTPIPGWLDPNKPVVDSAGQPLQVSAEIPLIGIDPNLTQGTTQPANVIKTTVDVVGITGGAGVATDPNVTSLEYKAPGAAGPVVTAAKSAGFLGIGNLWWLLILILAAGGLWYYYGRK